MYKEKPPRYVIQGENKVCRLRKTIHGLKQSPWAWLEKFNITISGVSFHHCHPDHSVFVQLTKYGLVILAVYVYDILLTGSESGGLVETMEYLGRIL